MNDTMRYWRYSDDLSVVDAALLIVGLNPGIIEVRGWPIEQATLVQPSLEGEDRYFFEQDFRAVFKALKGAILSDRLPANITRLCRDATYKWSEGEPYPDGPREDEAEFVYNRLLISPAKFYSTTKEITGGYGGEIYFIKEPDWFHTTVSVEDLKSWLATKGDRPEFFYPEERNISGYQDENHPRYSAKLAAAVAAWEAVEGASPNKTVKQTLERWLRENASQFGLVDDDGNPLSDVILELAKVVNWNTKGGAPRTMAGVAEDKPSKSRGSNFFTLGRTDDTQF